MGIIVNKNRLHPAGHATDGVDEDKQDEQSANGLGRRCDQRPAQGDEPAEKSRKCQQEQPTEDAVLDE